MVFIWCQVWQNTIWSEKLYIVFILYFILYPYEFLFIIKSAICKFKFKIKRFNPLTLDAYFAVSPGVPIIDK